MTTEQTPIHSGFGAASTAAERLASRYELAPEKWSS